MKKISVIQIFRIVGLSAFLLLITMAAVRHQVLGGGPQGSPSIHTLCPFGGLETLYKVAAGGEFIKKTNTSNFVLLAGTVVLAILFGRFFCGWICALGFLQELAGKLGRLVFRRKFTVPPAVDKPLRFLKYPLLAGILFFTWRMADLVVAPYDPFAAYAHIPAGFGELIDEFLIGSVILAGLLVLSLFYDRVSASTFVRWGRFWAL